MLAPAAAQAPTSNTDAVCTLAAKANYGWRVFGIYWSYTAAPTAATLVIAWTDPTAGAVTMTFAVTAAGPGQLLLNGEQNRFPANAAVTITLKAGGSGISGTVYADADLD